jgi:starch synthase
MALVFPFSDVEEIMLNGVIPISMNRPGIKDYNPNKETGNGFVYKKEDSWSIFAALVRAVETFKFPYDWKHIVRQGILSEDSKN